MRKFLLVCCFSTAVLLANAQWNPDPTENNLIISIDQKGTGLVTAPAAVSDGAGGMFIVWVDGRNSATTGNDIFLTRILANGSIAPGFAAGGNIVCNANGVQSNPDITEDGQGGVVVAWTDTRNTATNSNDIYAQRLTSTGEPVWAANGVAVAANSFSELTPAIALTSALEVAVVWRFTGNSTDLAFNYLALANGAKALASDIVITAGANAQSNQDVIADGNGGMIVVWTDGRTTNATSGIYAQRYNAGGIPQWTAGGLPVRAAGGSNTTAPALVSDGANGAVITWSDSRNGSTNADIYAQRISGFGDAEWAAEGIQITGATGQQLLPAIVKSAANFIISWNDQQNGTSNIDVYAQAVSLTGVKLWNEGNPVAVVSETGNQPLSNTSPVLVADALGGAVFVFDDRRNGTGNDDVYAQHISAAGAKQWAAAAIPVASRTGSNQIGPVAVAGLNNSVIVAWRDNRSGNTNAEIYASNVLRDGTLPVTLLEIGATLNGKVVDVKWTSTNEYKLSHFEIERSANGIDFDLAGKAPAKNIPGVHQYLFSDITPLSGVNFYRIKSTDIDGESRYSKIVTVSVVLQSDKALHLYPNPAVAEVNLQLNNLPAGTYTIRIIDVLGRTAQSRQINKGIPSQTTTLSVTGLSKGMYWIQVSNDKNQPVAVQPIAKQ